MKSIRVVLAALLVALSTPVSGAPEPQIVIPVIIPLTGGNAFAGNGQRTALGLLQTLVNRGGGIRGRSIVFDVHDSGSNSRVAVQMANQYVNNGVPLFIGDSSLATCAAISAIIAAHGPVQFCLSPGLQTKPDGYSFAPGHPSRAIVNGIIAYLRDKGLHRAALLVATDATGLQIDQFFSDAFAQQKTKDVELVDKERFNPDDISVGAQLARLKSSNAQIIIAYTNGAQFGTVLRGLIDSGIDLPVMTSQGNLTYAFLDQYKEVLPKTLLFASGPLPSVGSPVPNGPFKSVQESYLAAFRSSGIKPDFSEAIAWDAGTIAVAALRKLGPGATPEQVRAYVRGLHDFPGIQGMYDFRTGDGHGAPNTSILQWNPAKDAWFIIAGEGSNKKL